MIDQIKVVAKLRGDLVILREAKLESMAHWETENHELLDNIACHIVLLGESEKTLQESALVLFRNTGNKRPIPGVEIKLFTRLTYDPEQALAWATEHRMALQLNKATFEKIAKANPLGFVVVTLEPQAQIASDLDTILEEAHNGN